MIRMLGYTHMNYRTLLACFSMLNLMAISVSYAQVPPPPPPLPLPLPFDEPEAATAPEISPNTPEIDSVPFDADAFDGNAPISATKGVGENENIVPSEEFAPDEMPEIIVDNITESTAEPEPEQAPSESETIQNNVTTSALEKEAEAVRAANNAEIEALLSGLEDATQNLEAPKAPEISDKLPKERQKEPFKDQILPGFLYEKSFNKENKHLPIVLSHEELDKLLFNAAKHGNYDAVQALLNAGRDINIQNTSGNTPLILATKNHHPSIVAYLLLRQANPNIQNNAGQAALHLAAHFGIGDSIKRLVHTNADIDIQDRQGNTPLIVAALAGRVNAVKLLLELGANPNIQNNLGHSALHVAVYQGLADTARALLEEEANPLLRSIGAITPLTLARERSFPKIAALLQDAVLKGGYQLSSMPNIDYASLSHSEQKKWDRILAKWVEADRNFDQLTLEEKRSWNEKRKVLQVIYKDHFNPESAEGLSAIAAIMKKWDVLDSPPRETGDDSADAATNERPISASDFMSEQTGLPPLNTRGFDDMDTDSAFDLPDIDDTQIDKRFVRERINSDLTRSARSTVTYSRTDKDGTPPKNEDNTSFDNIKMDNTSFNDSTYMEDVKQALRDSLKESGHNIPDLPDDEYVVQIPPRPGTTMNTNKPIGMEPQPDRTVEIIAPSENSDMKQESEKIQPSDEFEVLEVIGNWEITTQLLSSMSPEEKRLANQQRLSALRKIKNTPTLSKAFNNLPNKVTAPFNNMMHQWDAAIAELDISQAPPGIIPPTVSSIPVLDKLEKDANLQATEEMKKATDELHRIIEALEALEALFEQEKTE